MIAIQMIQTPTGLNSAYRHAFRNLTYAGMPGRSRLADTGLIWSRFALACTRAARLGANVSVRNRAGIS